MVSLAASPVSVRHRLSALARPTSMVRTVVLAYLAARAVTTALFLMIGPAALPGSIPGPDSGLLTQLTAWDGDWFRRVASEGYPAVLPREDGVVVGNAWAFLPLYPVAVKALVLGHPTYWPVAAVLLSTACGLVAALLLAELVRRHGGEPAAIVAAVLFSFGPTSYVLQMAYAESMGLALLFLLLLLVDSRRYWIAAAVAVPLALTRPGMQAVALFVLLHFLLRIRRARHGTEGLRPRTAVAIVVLGGVAAVSGFTWPVLAGLSTGQHDAYLATELSWRAPYTGSAQMEYFTPWLVAFDGLFGEAGPTVLVGVLLLSPVVLFVPPVRRLGATLRMFAASWLLYLLAIFYPQSSTWRLLMPVAGLGGALPLTTKPRLAVGVVVVVALQGALMWTAFGAPHGQYSPP